MFNDNSRDELHNTNQNQSIDSSIEKSSITNLQVKNGRGFRPKTAAIGKNSHPTKLKMNKYEMYSSQPGALNSSAYPLTRLDQKAKQV